MQTPSFSRRLFRHSLLRTWGLVALTLLGLLIISPSASAQVLAASEANLVLPDLRSQTFLGINGWWHDPAVSAAVDARRSQPRDTPHVVSSYGPPLEHIGGVIVV